MAKPRLAVGSKESTKENQDRSNKNADGRKEDKSPASQQPSLESQSSTALDATALFLGLVLVALLFNAFAPQPYMDEPFHIGQTERYCRGQFREWDPKITTFPGLYFFGAFIGQCWHAVQVNLQPGAIKTAQLCSVPALRATNIVFLLICYLLSLKIYRQLHPRVRSVCASQMAMLVVLLPTSFFFAFLYYTDAGALMFFLATYYAALEGRHTLAGLFSGVSVLFRQTNAVWGMFVLGAVVIRMFAPHKVFKDPSSALLKQVIVLLHLCWLNVGLLLSRLWALILVLLAFAVFVLLNGGIVVGDKANHRPQLHLMQPLYFALFTVAVLPQIFFNPSRLAEGFKGLTIAFRRKPAKVLKPLGMAFVLTTFVVHKYTLVHPFLLADSRHYTFYLWKDIIAAYPAARYCLVPLYLFAGFSIIERLRAGGQSKTWLLLFGVSTALTLVPAWLLEFRYFTIPFVLVLLHMKPPSPQVMLQSILVFAAVNAVTIYIFLFRPFLWADGSVARFLW